MSDKILKLEVEKRDSLGKQHLKTIRRDDGIPGVYYSFDSKSSINFLVSKSEINEAIKSDANIFAINVGGENRNVLFFVEPCTNPNGKIFDFSIVPKIRKLCKQ